MYQSEIVAPSFFDRSEDAEFMIEKIRDLGWPIIVARFEEGTGVEAQERINEINQNLASRGLPEFPPVKYRRNS